MIDRTQERFGLWPAKLDPEAIKATLGEVLPPARGLGARPDGRAGTPWPVAVERPDHALRSAMDVIELRDAAIATSGDYRPWSDLGGPADDGITSVSVVAESCMDADAWATALMVLGPARGEALPQRRGFDALFIRRAGGMLTEIPVGPTFRSIPLPPARMAGPGDCAAAAGA